MSWKKKNENLCLINSLWMLTIIWIICIPSRPKKELLSGRLQYLNNGLSIARLPILPFVEILIFELLLKEGGARDKGGITARVRGCWKYKTMVRPGWTEKHLKKKVWIWHYGSLANLLLLSVAPSKLSRGGNNSFSWLILCKFCSFTYPFFKSSTRLEETAGDF